MKKHTKRSAFFILILLVIFSCSKDNELNELENSNINLQENSVELSQVKEIAEEIYFATKTNSSASKGNTVKSEKRTIEAINEVRNEKGKTSFYVINYNEGGYILLSADKRTQPILGYSESGKFEVDEDSYPLGLKLWMKDAKSQITDIQNSNIEQSEKEKQAWKQVQYEIASSSSSILAKEEPFECYEHTETITVGPLLSSTWYQTGAFNDALSYINCTGANFQVFAGCVPIAMAQVMKYHQYPTNYNWSSMPLTYGTTTTANFIADIHDAIGNVYSGNPIYDCDGTGVSASANMGNVLKTQFNYSSALWANFNYNTVKSNLNYNRPVILSGDNGSTGHMWVCDGYRQTSYYFADCTGGTFYPVFHMNWGWNGAYDGYYSYNNFSPSTTNYNNNKKMIYNIIP
ncbi:C10 family peptidase [Flavivirga aquimarina]|uniref:C10 family peptidase n=1 Tax=Flavivirga aquimarina TaxID=2027862 RepID=A0ABT8W9X5_9FLAO|nr:C10 family peptidase [Flavivirga aquimarina]MDO5969949.1 C10 family peptidase [Flavivirga aquimarina]